jgi:hypothetical protein
MVNDIENTHQGTLVISGLGQFKIHNINQIKEEQEIVRKRIFFETLKYKDITVP